MFRRESETKFEDNKQPTSLPLSKGKNGDSK